MNVSHLTVGLFDDTPAGLDMMEELLEATLRFLHIKPSDVDIRKTNDRREAERIAESGDCHLILTDLVWPMTEGTEWPEGHNIAEVARFANPRTVIVIITARSAQERHFRGEAKRRGANLALTWEEAFGLGKLDNAKDLAARLEIFISSAVPKFESVERSIVGLVGLDTVAFSEEDDETQLALIESFLSYMEESWSKVARPLVRPIFVFTGDGLFLGLAGDDGPRLALDVGITAWQRFTKLARYKTRIAVHSGPTNICTLSSGAQQLLGHSVNWLFRAMNSAPDDGLVVTHEYFESVLQNGRENPTGLSFAQREAKAKHDRPLIVYDVTMVSNRKGLE